LFGAPAINIEAKTVGAQQRGFSPSPQLRQGHIMEFFVFKTCI